MNAEKIYINLFFIFGSSIPSPFCKVLFFFISPKKLVQSVTLEICRREFLVSNLGLDPGYLFEVACGVRRFYHVNSPMAHRIGNVMYFFMALQPSWTLGRFSRVLKLYTGGRTPWVGNEPVTRPLPAQDNTNTE